MKLLQTSRRTLIGVDVGARSVKAVQARVRGQRVTQIVSAMMDLPADGAFDEAQAARFRGVLQRRGMAGQALAIGAASHLLRMEAMELPPAAGAAALHQLAAVEMGRIARLKPGSFENGVWEIPAPARGGTTAHLMSAALPHAAADALVGPLMAAGFDVAAICPGPACLATLAGRLLTSDAALHAIVDVGWTSTRLLIVHGSQIVFHRTVQDSGVAMLRDEIVKEFKVPAEVAEHLLKEVGLKGAGDMPAGAAHQLRRLLERAISTIAGELQLTQNYITHRYQQFSLDSLILCGGGAAIPGFPDALAAATKKSTVCLTPASFCTSDPTRAAPVAGPVATTALGIALYAQGVEQ
jgi:type IV pilus assembly protein PilM